MLKEICILLCVLAGPVFTIPKEQVSQTDVYYGSSEFFKTPASFNPEKVLKSTKQYKLIEKEKIAVGTGKYWILLAQANSALAKACIQYAENSHCDFLAANLSNSEFNAPDATESIVKQLGDEKVSTGPKNKMKHVAGQDGCVINPEKKK